MAIMCEIKIIIMISLFANWTITGAGFCALRSRCAPTMSPTANGFASVVVTTLWTTVLQFSLSSCFSSKILKFVRRLYCSFTQACCCTFFTAVSSCTIHFLFSFSSFFILLSSFLSFMLSQRCQPRTDDICKTMLGIL